MQKCSISCPRYHFATAQPYSLSRFDAYLPVLTKHAFVKSEVLTKTIQGWANECDLGCVKPYSQEVGYTQPRTHTFSPSLYRKGTSICSPSLIPRTSGATAKMTSARNLAMTELQNIPRPRRPRSMRQWARTLAPRPPLPRATSSRAARSPSSFSWAESGPETRRSHSSCRHET